MQYIQSNTSTPTVNISSLRRSADVPITVRRRSAAVLLTCHKSVVFFQFLNVKMYNYGKQNIIVNFIIKKLKKKQFPQKV